MSQSSRAERRRSTRGDDQPPRKRDPMVPIYIGLAAVVVLVFVGFGIANFFANRAHADAIAYDYSTPSPLPAPTPKPVQLKDRVPVGLPTGFPQPNLAKNQLTDTKQGGNGAPVDGIPCESSEQVSIHVHSHLAIIANGKAIQIPPYIGMAAGPTGGCLYWLHTHDGSGIIHVEAGDPSTPNGGPFTLGNFFDIWGQPLSNNQIGPYVAPVTMYVNGVPYNGDPRAIPLRSHQIITLETGNPVPPPNYLIPKGD